MGVRVDDIQILYSPNLRGRVLAASAFLILAIALADWKIEPNVSLGFLYLLPILLAAGFLNRWQILLTAAVCAILREVFSPFTWDAEGIPRLVMVMTAFAGSGFFVRELVRNRQRAMEHLSELEQQIGLRREAQEQLRLLVESSPAAILTLDGAGKIQLANEAAHEMLECEEGSLEGQPIEPYLPVLSMVLGSERIAETFRTTMEGIGRRSSGEIFLAQMWVSNYATVSGPRLAAIIFDASEQLRDQEESGLHRLLHSSRVLMGAVSHEVRNLCAAMEVVCANLRRAPGLAESEDLQALGTLVEGLKRIASAEPGPRAEARLSGVDLGEVLEELRIILEPSLRELEASVGWEGAEDLPPVRAERSGLLQVFLNLGQNCRRALERVDEKRFTVRASLEGCRVVVRFHNNGPGIAEPEHLFQPFQAGAEGTGLGLYVSRAILRSFSGNLSYERVADGCCFAVELEAVPVREAVEA
jgi:PAS domain S-box-containing protein